jgi:hypothetical protein
MQDTLFWTLVLYSGGGGGYFLETEIKQKVLARTNSILPFQSQSNVTTDSRPVCLGVKPQSRAQDKIFVTVRQLGVCWSEGPSLTFTIAAGPRQRSHSQVRVPWDSWPHFTVIRFDTPSTWRVRSPYLYTPRNRVAQLYPQGTGFYFRRLLRLASVGWMYSIPPSRRGPHRKHHVQHFFYCCVCIRYGGNVFTDPLPSNDRWHTQTYRQFGNVINFFSFFLRRKEAKN